MNDLQLKAVNFHNQELITLEHEGVAHVAAKPIIENLGLSWSTQRQKLAKNSDKFNCVHMNMVAEDGKNREMLVMPLIKLNGWLFSINPAKVREDLREKVIQYQEECFVVLYNYWNKGAAVNPRMNLTEEQKGHIKDVMRRRVGKLGSSFQAEWGDLNRHFGVATYKDIKAEHYPLVCEYLGVEPLEGEFIPSQDKPKQEIDTNYLYMWQKVAQRRLHELKEVERVMYNALGEIEGAMGRLSKTRANLYDPIIEPLHQLNVVVDNSKRQEVLDRVDKIIQEQDFLRAHKRY